MWNDSIVDCTLHSRDALLIAGVNELRIVDLEPINPKSEIRNRKSRGVSIIAAVFIIVILAFMGVMFVSLIGTSSLTSVNDLQSTQMFYIAEGGLEYGKKYLRPYSNWYTFSTDPVNAATNQALGSGAFTVSINFPATTVKKSFGAGATVIRVFSVDKFPGSGSLYIGGITYTYTGTATDAPLGPRFTGVAASSLQGAGTEVDPLLTLSAGITATDSTIAFNDSGSGNGMREKFLTRGTILIESEEITYSGIQGTTFTGCMRGVNTTTAAAHAAGLAVIPLGSTSEAYISSTGTMNSISGTIMRVITDVADQ